MNSLPKKGVYRRPDGFTLLELLLTAALIGILVALIIPTLIKAWQKVRAAECISQLRQAGMAFIGYADDHKDRFPMMVPANKGGTLEYQISGPSYLHFQSLSNYLDSPKIFSCPSNTNQPTRDWNQLHGNHLSYFLNAHAKPRSSQTILMGDASVLVGAKTVPKGKGLYLSKPRHISWSDNTHAENGNLLFGDGHVEISANEDLPTKFFTSIKERHQ